MVTEFELIDDGTMDTVIRHKECGTELRYTFGGESEDGSYEKFIEWCKEDAAEQHECPTIGPMSAADIRDAIEDEAFHRNR